MERPTLLPRFAPSFKELMPNCKLIEPTEQEKLAQLGCERYTPVQVQRSYRTWLTLDEYYAMKGKTK